MATGDEAAAAGMDLVPGSTPAKDIDTEINKTRDYIAQARAYAAGLVAGISLTWSSITGKPTHYASRSDIVTRPGVAGTVETALNDIFGLAAAALPKSGGTMTGHLYSPPARSTPVNTSYVAAYLDGAGRLGATPSAAKYKHDIESYEGSALGLRAVTYILNDDDNETVRLGIVADEANEIEPFLVVHEDGEVESFKYELLAVALLRDLQRTNAAMVDLESRIAELEGNA